MHGFIRGSVFGQSAAGTISGRVTDGVGAVIVGAAVDLTNIERGTVSTVPANEAGIYAFPSVQPGHYRMTVRAQGFKQGEVSGLLWKLVAAWSRTLRWKSVLCGRR
jgi:hypothetical protein